jgi:hypothetical protein
MDGGSFWLSSDIPVMDQVGGFKHSIPGHGEISALPSFATDRSKTSHNGLLYIVWADLKSGKDNSNVWLTRSNNFGDIWTVPLRVNHDNAARHQYLPAMAIDQTTGHIYIVYYNRDEYDDHTTDVWLAYSRDSGSSFKSIKISESSFTPNEKTPIGSSIGISAHKGIISPAWTQQINGTTKIVVGVLTDADLPK